MIKKGLQIAIIFFALYLSSISDAFAQIVRPAIGSWNTYLPYNTVIDFDTDGNMFYCVSTSSFFTYDQRDGSVTAYSKANGMSDVGMKNVAYDNLTETAVLIYQNGNIDLFKDGKFYNIPDFKITTVASNKTIYSVYCGAGYAFVSTGSGLIVVNINKKEIKETIPFYNGTNLGFNTDATGKGQTVYAATSIGLFQSSVNNPLLLNYATWTKLSSLSIDFVSQRADKLFAVSGQTLYILNNGTLNPIKNIVGKIQDIDATSSNAVWIMTVGANPYALKVDANGTVTDSIGGFFANRFLDLGDGKYWSSDAYAGLKSKSSNVSGNTWTSYNPAGPYTNGAFDVWAKDGMFWLAHGGRNLTSWAIQMSQEYFSKYDKGYWNLYKWKMLGFTNKPWAMSDAISVVKDESSGDVYFAMYNGGLVKLDKSDNITNYKKGYLEYNNEGDTASYRVTDLALDADNNLWITQSTANNVLRVKTKDNNWYNFKVNGVVHGASLAIDDLGQKWFASGYKDGGLVVYNDNGTISNPTDDKSIILRAGKNAGNLPDNNVLCIAKDKDGGMWIGTSNGIGIFNCDLDIRKTICDAYLKGLQSKGYNFANYLFQGMAVRSIAVDGGNRKWVGTDAGLFLVSEDANEILAQYDESNSPLLSNTILNIKTDPTTGIVYLCTDKGLCSIGGAATEAGNAIETPLFVYPNPVPSGYNGMIAIKGMTASSDVRITDINGQLVYRTTSTGGQVAWNGKDYNGRKVQSGVYLVFVVSKDGTKKATGKFILHE